MIRVLHVVSIMDRGGMESYIMNIYRCIDRTTMQFDFLVHHAKKGAFEDEINALGGNVYRTTFLDDFNLLRYREALRRIYADGDYRVIHGHLGSTACLYLSEAEKMGVPWRILHAHCSNHTKSLKGVLKHIMFGYGPQYANIKLACSQRAGEYLFRQKPFEETTNGIAVEHFLFSQMQRNAFRKQLNLTRKYVIGHVGRFTAEKNHAYLLEVFKKLHRKIPEAVLLLVGEGPLKKKMQNKVSIMGLDTSVCFMGMQADCAPFYQAMDVFVMPSLYEGMPLSGIEAQCAGLPCVFSSTVSPEIKIDSLVSFLPINKSAQIEWVNLLQQLYECKNERKKQRQAFAEFDVQILAHQMEERYKALCEEEA